MKEVRSLGMGTNPRSPRRRSQARVARENFRAGATNFRRRPVYPQSAIYLGVEDLKSAVRSLDKERRRHFGGGGSSHSNNKQRQYSLHSVEGAGSACLHRERYLSIRTHSSFCGVRFLSVVAHTIAIDLITSSLQLT